MPKPPPFTPNGEPDDETPAQAPPVEPAEEPAEPAEPAEAAPAGPQSEVMKAIRALQAGERTIEDVEQMFSTRKWPEARPPAADAAEAFRREQEDAEPEPSGSFAEVAQAFYTGIIDIDTYERLAAAAAAGRAAAVGNAAADDAADEGTDTDADTDADVDADDEEKS